MKSKEELDHKKYGIIVKSGNRRGLLLPDLEGVDTVDEQIRIASMKAGEVTEVNEGLRADPALANSDPLGAGWFFKVKLSDASQVDALLDATAYEAFSKQG